MKITRVAVVVSALALPLSLATLGACESMQSVTNSASAIQKLAGDWNLSSLRGVDVASMLPKGMKLPSLSFSNDGSVSGNSGINRLASSLDLDALAKGQFKLAPSAGTKMAGSPEAMAFENDFLKTLGEVTGFSAKGDSLTLSNAAGELMKFVRAG